MNDQRKYVLFICFLLLISGLVHLSEGQLFITAQPPDRAANDRARSSSSGALRNNPGSERTNRSWKNAWTFTSRNFRVRSNISRGATRNIARLMERFLKSFNTLFETSINRKIDVLVPRTRAQFERIRDVEKHVRGWFSPLNGGRIVTYDQPGDVHSTKNVLLHEATHMVLLLGVTDFNPPEIWVMEGLAVYFEASEFDGTELIVGKIPRPRLINAKKMVMKNEYTPIRTLVQKSPDNFTERDYAQAWSLVYYFLHARNHGWVDRFDTYLLSFKHHPDMNPETRFKNAFQTPVNKIEQDWIRFVKSLGPGDEDTVRITGDDQ